MEKDDSKKRSPEVTIVVPVHNRAALVERTLDSIQRQTYRPLSVVLVDNNSSDGTKDVLLRWRAAAEDSSLRITVTEETRKGAAAARNRGLECVDTEWVMFFDSDDEMLPDHVALALAAADDDVDVVGWNVRCRSLSGKILTLPFFDKDLQYHNLFHGGFATLRYMVRTEVARAVGGWNPEVRRWDDIELGARLIEHGVRVRHRKGDVTVVVHAMEESISGAGYSDNVESIDAALESIARQLGGDRRRWVDLKRVILAGDCTLEGALCGERIYKDVMRGTKSAYLRFLWRMAYAYKRRGGRGIARIYKSLGIL